MGKLSTAAIALAGLVAAASIAALWAAQSTQDDAQALLDGTITPETFVERAAPFVLMGVVQLIGTAATAVVTMIWMSRLAKNHRTLHRHGTWGPGWAIAGWFLPPLIFVIPFLMFRELWKASAPDASAGHDWRSGPVSWLVPAWFVAYSVLPIILLVAESSSGLTLGATERDLAQQIIDDQTITTVSAIVAVAGAIVFAMLVRGLTARHRQLTGEAAA